MDLRPGWCVEGSETHTGGMGFFKLSLALSARMELEFAAVDDCLGGRGSEWEGGGLLELEMRLGSGKSKMRKNNT